MPSICYQAVTSWKPSDWPCMAESPELRTIQIQLTRSEYARILDQNRTRSANAMQRILLPKIRPAYIANVSNVCMECRCPATRMVNTLSLHRESPEGPTLLDHTPFPICEYAHCHQSATRVAHEYRQGFSECDPTFSQAEFEVCDNCEVKRSVIENGRMPRCSRCKAKRYCSKQCQIESWKKGHKLHCRSVS